MSEGALISPESRLTIPEHVLSRKAAGETVLLNLDNEEYYGLDGVGTRLWELIETGTTFEAAVATLLGEYDVDRDTLVGDLNELLADLRRCGLVTVSV